MTQIQELCPFCGGEAKGKNLVHGPGEMAFCDNEGCGVYGIYVDVATWNTRSLPALIAAAKGMGYAVVPVEPSEAMIEAGAHFCAVCASTIDCGDCSQRLESAMIYRAMISTSQGRG